MNVCFKFFFIFFISFRPDHNSSYIIGHYHFPTSFQNITYIADKMIGLTLNDFDAKVMAVHQYKGRKIAVANKVIMVEIFV